MTEGLMALLALAVFYLVGGPTAAMWVLVAIGLVYVATCLLGPLVNEIAERPVRKHIAEVKEFYRSKGDPLETDSERDR
jgi:thiosulfate reductase cytochrome b subunit